MLRLKPKDHIIVLNNTGWEYEVEIEKASGELVQGEVVRKGLSTGELVTKITLYQALLKADEISKRTKALAKEKGLEKKKE